MTTSRVSPVVLLSLVPLALGCKSEPTMSSLAEQNKAGVEAFIEQLLEVEAKLDAAPKAADGFEVGDDVELRPYDEDGKLGNTVVIHQRDLGGWLKNTPDRIEYDPPELGPRSSLELQRLVVWTRTKRWSASDNTSKRDVHDSRRAFQQALGRAVTVALKTKKPVDSLAQVAPKSSKSSSSKSK